MAYRCRGGGDAATVFPEGAQAALYCRGGSRQRPPNQGGVRGLTIDAVSYGARGRFCDATSSFARRCDGEYRCLVEVDNRLCGDPSKNERRPAEIAYRCTMDVA